MEGVGSMSKTEPFSERAMWLYATEWCRENNIQLSSLMVRNRQRSLVRARRALIVYLYEGGWSFPEIGWFLDLDHSTVSHHYHRHESDQQWRKSA